MPEGKVVIVGDGAIGKTLLLTSLLQEDGVEIDWDNETYQPTAVTNLSAEWEHTDMEGAMHDFALEVYDTTGREALKSLRNMSYPDTDIFLMAYDMTRKNTLKNIVVHDLNDMASYELPDPEEEDEEGLGGWVSEIIAGCPEDFHIILVGCKADYWEELNASGTPEQKAELTTWQQGYDVARAIGAKAYIQTSAKTYQGLLEAEEGMKGGPADTQVNPDGVWLKSMICELRAKSLGNKEVSVVEKAPGATAPEAAAPEAGCLGGAKMSEWV